MWTLCIELVAFCSRTGGLTNEVKTGKTAGGIIMAGPDTFGLPPKAAPGSILRRQVCLKLSYVYV